MITQLKEMFQGLITSKKFVAMIFLMIFVIIAYSVEIPTELIITVSTGFCTYIIGQGLADNGKESVKIESKMETDETIPDESKLE